MPPLSLVGQSCSQPAGTVSVQVVVWPGISGVSRAVSQCGFATLPHLINSVGVSVWSSLLRSLKVPKAQVLASRTGRVVCPDAIGALQQRTFEQDFPWAQPLWSDQFDACLARALELCECTRAISTDEMAYDWL